MTNYKKFLFLGLLLCFIFQLRLSAQIKIEIADANSLVQMGTIAQSPDGTDRKMALTFLSALKNNNMDSVKVVERYYFDMSQKLNTIQNNYSSLYWICKAITAEKESLEKEIDEPLYENLFHFFTDNNYENLKYYLVIRYGLPDDTPHKNKYVKSFYIDFLTLNTPIREVLEKTDSIMNFLPLKKGDKVIDVGCGLGYNTFKLVKIVGTEGRVYATDIDSLFVNYLKQITDKAKIKNIFPLLTSPNKIGVSDNVDAVFICGLFHHFYGRTTEPERTELYNSMKQVLKRGGYLIIEDNLSTDKSELINFNIDKRLLIAHLAFWGFTYVDYKEFPPLSYVLIFKHTDEKVNSQTLFAKNKPADVSSFLDVDSRMPLFFFAWQRDNNITPAEKEAAQMAYDFFETGNMVLAKKAINMYEKFIAVENIGGEYAAIQWLCDVKSSSEEKRKIILENNLLSGSFYNTMTNNNDSLIKFYLKYKYKLLVKEPTDKSDTLSHEKNELSKTQLIRSLENYILSFNPSFKKANSIIEKMNIQKNQIIVHLGLGQGYFSYLFSQLTGAQGKVYAIEPLRKHYQAFDRFIKEHDLKNIKIIKTATDSFSIKEKADKIFLCSLYPKLYSNSENNRRKFINTIIENLAPEGHLFIVDNGPVDNKNLPYQGSFISKTLIVCQLAFYGFELIDDLKVLPHSYMLTFRLKNK